MFYAGDALLLGQSVPGLQVSIDNFFRKSSYVVFQCHH